jgi:hypothetical protein
VTDRKERIPTERIIECLRETNGLVSLAAKRVPCSISTINARRKRVKAVEDVVRECRDELVDYGELALRRAVVAGEPWAVALVLKTLGRGRGYVERQEMTGAKGSSLAPVVAVLPAVGAAAPADGDDDGVDAA